LSDVRHGLAQLAFFIFTQVAFAALLEQIRHSFLMT
jgi:hypothetical protein